MKRYLAESVGTFVLMFVIGMTVVNPGSAGALAPLAIGGALMVMVYSGGPVSGGHYNPAVTLGVLLRGKCPASDVVPYVLVQILAASAAAATVLFLKGSPPVSAAAIESAPAFVAELIGTFALVYVVLTVATSAKSAGNSYFGLAIGFTVTVFAFAVGGVSGGAFNPAVAVGLVCLGLMEIGKLAVLFGGELVGAVLAVMVYRICNPDEIV